MRRFIVGSLVANAVVVACGTSIDTSLPSGEVANDGGTTALGDGGGIVPGTDSATPDVFTPPDCTTVFTDEFDDTDSYDFGAHGWTPQHESGLNVFAEAGGVPTRLHVNGSTALPAYVQRSLTPSCSRVSVTVRFEYLAKPSFDLLSVGLGDGDDARRLVISYAAYANVFTAASLDPMTDAGSASSKTVPPSNPTTDATFYVLHAVFSRKGEVWAMLDNAPGTVVDTSLSSLVVPAFPDGSVPFRYLRIGIENASAGDSAIDVDSISIKPE